MEPQSPMPTPDITTARLSMVALSQSILTAISAGSKTIKRFRVPDGWPDEADQVHVNQWLRQAPDLDGADEWRPRGIIDHQQLLVGHAGFHQPPTTIEQALDDPSFVGKIEPSSAAAVELGYTVFSQHRGRGYATEAATGLIDWAMATGRVSTVLASVSPTNNASLRVLERVGGFIRIGQCSDEDGHREFVFRRDR